jgi:predicted nucleotidyltransferase
MVPNDRVDAALTAVLEDADGLVSAYIFGSMARGRAHRESDVDVGVLLDRRIHPLAADRFEARLRLAALLQAAVGRHVDIVILNDAPPQLCRQIITAGRRLVIADPTMDHAHLRVTLSRAADLEPFLKRARAIKLAVLAP